MPSARRPSASPEIRIFGPDGAFRGRVGREGEGPGEFLQPSELYLLAGDTLAVFDTRSRRLSWFLPDGTFLRSLPLHEVRGLHSPVFPRLSVAGDLFLRGYPEAVGLPDADGLYRYDQRIVAYQQDGDPVPLVERFPAAEQQISMDREDGGVDRILRLDRPRRPFTDALVDSLHAAALEEADPDRRPALRATLAERTYPDSLPALQDLFADRAGRLWIAPVRLPLPNLPGMAFRGAREWILFGEDGEMLGRIDLPPRSIPLDGDAAGLLLLRFDQMDVPYVEWVPLVAREVLGSSLELEGDPRRSLPGPAETALWEYGGEISLLAHPYAIDWIP